LLISGIFGIPGILAADIAEVAGLFNIVSFICQYIKIQAKIANIKLEIHQCLNKSIHKNI
jgi:hypothetical protein